MTTPDDLAAVRNHIETLARWTTREDERYASRTSAFSHLDRLTARLEELEAARTLAVSHLDWCIGYVATAADEDWRTTLAIHLGNARAALTGKNTP